MVDVQIEKIRLENAHMAKLFNKEFLAEISGVNPVAMLLIQETDKKGDKKPETIMVSLSHSSKKESDSGILHLECTNPEVLEKVKKAIQKFQ